jgi:response regulator RpfG family c-di-GMP phosphodiesterase
MSAVAVEVQSQAQAEAEAALQPTILCVDDEPNILASLQRLFRKNRFRVLCADSAAAGLAVLAQEAVDVVISDMRMPACSGADFLERVRAGWPGTMRLLLTGYADVGSIVGAINRGEIYRYITKPWDEADILQVVHDALGRHALEHEKDRLERLTRTQNLSLLELNATLEDRVRARTAELEAARQALLQSNDRLRGNFLTSIKVLSGMIEMRGGAMAGHARSVADLARRVALRMGLSAREAQDVFIAGLLHEIGKIGFPDALLRIPEYALKGDALGQYRKYPQDGALLLLPLDELRIAARVVGAHRERFDGTGFPHRLAGFDIPLGARILAVAYDFVALQSGQLVQRQVDGKQAAALLAESRGKRYDPEVIEAFYAVRTGRDVADAVPDIAMAIPQLKPGMTLARDLVSDEGALLLSADHVLSERLIRQLADFEQRAGTTLQLYIKTGTS